jgi:hypothetical protein
MQLPTITAPVPSTSPAVAAKTYTAAWCQQINIDAPSPAELVTARIALRNYDGAGTLDPNPANGYSFVLDDVFAFAAEYPVVGAQVLSLLATIAKIAPVKHLGQQLAAANASLTTAQQELTEQTALLARANAMPPQPVKAPTIASATAAIAAANDQINTLTAQITSLTASLATAQAALSA